MPRGIWSRRRVVLFEGDQAVAGKEALKAIATEAEQVAQCAKRELGERTFHKPLDGRKFPPEACRRSCSTSCVKTRAARSANSTKVVITVPAYFDEVRRKATQDAGYMAGFEVLDIINEPTAAAIAHGFLKGFLNREGAANAARKLLVYDLGGGTFDVTVMEIRGNEFLALATDGDVQLGGQDLGQAVGQLRGRGVHQRTHDLDPREDPNTAGRLWRECEDAKRTLSARTKASISCDYKGQAVRVEVTREKFEEMTQDLLNRTAVHHQANSASRRAELERPGLRAAGRRIDPHADGGPACSASCRARSPTRRWRSTRPWPTARRCTPRCCWPRAAVKRRSSTSSNVNSHSLGVVATDRRTGRKRNAILVPRNTPLPVTAKRVFRTQRDRPADDSGANRRGRKRLARGLLADRHVAWSATCPAICRPKRRSRSASPIRKTDG